MHLLDGQFAYAEPLRLALQNLALGRPNPSYDAAPDVLTLHLARQRLHGRDRAAAREARERDLEAAHHRLPVLGDEPRRGGRAHGRPVQPLPPQRPLVRDRARPRPRRRAHLPRSTASAATCASRPAASATSACRRSSTRAPTATAPPWQLGESDEQADDPGRARAPRGSSSAPSASTARVEHRDDRSLALHDAVRATGRLLAGWMIGLDGLASPLSPPELVERVAAALERVAADHEGEPAARTRCRSSCVDRARAARARRVARHARALRGAPGHARRRARRPAASSKDAIIDAAELEERFKLNDEELEDHLQLLNLVNFGGGCYAVYAERVDDGRTIHVEKELYGDEFRRPARLSPLEAKALLLALDLVGPLVAADAGTTLDDVRAKLEAAFGRYDMRGAPTPQPTPLDEDVLSVLSATRARAATVVEIDYLGTPGRRRSRAASSSRTTCAACAATGTATPGIARATASARSASTASARRSALGETFERAREPDRARRRRARRPRRHGLGLVLGGRRALGARGPPRHQPPRRRRRARVGALRLGALALRRALPLPRRGRAARARGAAGAGRVARTRARRARALARHRQRPVTAGQARWLSDAQVAELLPAPARGRRARALRARRARRGHDRAAAEAGDPPARPTPSSTRCRPTSADLDGTGVKLVSVFPGNRARGLPADHGDRDRARQRDRRSCAACSAAPR